MGFGFRFVPVVVAFVLGEVGDAVDSGEVVGDEVDGFVVPLILGVEEHLGSGETVGDGEVELFLYGAVATLAFMLPSKDRTVNKETKVTNMTPSAMMLFPLRLSRELILKLFLVSTVRDDSKETWLS